MAESLSGVDVVNAKSVAKKRSPRFPIVYLNHSRAIELESKFPGRVGLMMGPSRMRPFSLPFVLDNDRFSAWSKSKPWDAAAFVLMLDKVLKADVMPKWAVVPDVVGDADGTFREWEKWSPMMLANGFQLALAVQDGMTPESVRRNASPDVIFVGGTTDWKRRTIWNWCHSFDRVHVGRINTEKWLWNVHRCGAESSDGTGWFRGDQVQRRGLERYLERTKCGLDTKQTEIVFSCSVDSEIRGRKCDG